LDGTVGKSLHSNGSNHFNSYIVRENRPTRKIFKLYVCNILADNIRLKKKMIINSNVNAADVFIVSPLFKYCKKELWAGLRRLERNRTTNKCAQNRLKRFS